MERSIYLRDDILDQLSDLEAPGFTGIGLRAAVSLVLKTDQSVEGVNSNRMMILDRLLNHGGLCLAAIKVNAEDKGISSEKMNAALTKLFTSSPEVALTKEDVQLIFSCKPTREQLTGSVE